METQFTDKLVYVRAAVQLTITCRIEKIVSLMHSTAPGKGSLRSEVVSSSLAPHVSWQLSVYPDSYSKEDGCCMSVFLHLAESTVSMKRPEIYLSSIRSPTRPIQLSTRRPCRQLDRPCWGRKGIAQLAPTRWVQRHETLAAFKELLPAIVDALRKLNQGESTSIASDLLGGLSTFASIFSIVVAEKAAADLKFLANFLQTKSLDLLRAYDEIDAVRRVLQNYLDEPLIFEELFNEAKQLCEKLGIKDDVLSWEVDRPMVLRSYVRERIYDSYLGGIIGGIDQRFGKRQLTAFKLQLLLPARVEELSYEAVSDVVTQYESLLPSPSDVPSEISRWRKKWILTDKGANSVIDAIADPIVFLSYPNIHMLLQVLATLPVSTATPERSFSTLGRIFTDQRASMGTKRVSQLALLSTYKKELDLLDVDGVVDNFAAKSTRRLDLK